MILTITDYWSNKSERLEGSASDIENQLAHRFPDISLQVDPAEGLDALIEYLNASIAGTEFVIEPLELSKAQTPPKAFPKLGVHAPGDSVMPVSHDYKITAKVPGQEEPVTRSQLQIRAGLQHSEATKDWGDGRKAGGYKDQRASRMAEASGHRGAHFATADSSRGWAQATHPFEETFNGTLNHEKWHALITAAGRKYGNDAQANLARNLFNAIPGQYQPFIRDQQNFFNDSYEGKPKEHDELIARMFNYVNSDADRESYHKARNHGWVARHLHNIAIKRAIQSLHAIAPIVGRAWLNQGFIKDHNDGVKKSEQDLHKSESSPDADPTPQPLPKPRKPRAKSNSTNVPEEPTLVVHHNLTAANLIHAHGLGGLIAPSLAISHKNHPLTGFGEITLIGDDKLADPQHTPVFDADVYSPRHPKPKYRLNEGHLHALQTQLKPHIANLRNHSDYREELERGNVDDLISNRNTREPLAAQFFHERGHKVELPMKPARLEADWVAMPSMQKWVHAHPKPDLNWVRGEVEGPSDDWKSMSQAARDAMTEWEGQLTQKLQEPETDEDTGKVTTRTPAGAAQFAKDIVDAGREHHFDSETGHLNFSKVDKLYASAKKVGTTEPDTYAYGDTLQNKLKEGNHEQDFRAWAKAKLQPIVGEPYIPKTSFDYNGNRRERKLAYTPENILREMTKKIRAGENFHYGLGTARSMGAKKFKNLQQLKNDRSKIVSSEEMKIAKEKQEQDWNELTELVMPNHSNPHQMQTLDGLAEAIGNSYSRGKSLRSELDLSGFRNLSEKQILAVRQFADNLLKMPTEYFEAKPQRVVPLHEFRAAVIPKGTEPEVREILRHHGIDHIEEYVPYDGNDEDRQEAILRAANAKKLMLSENLVKAIDDIAPATTSDSLGHNYDHVLKPSHVEDGFSLRVTHDPVPNTQNHRIVAKAYKKSNSGRPREIGHVNGYAYGKTGQVTPHSEIEEQYQGMGLGRAMYEAVYKHAATHLGIKVAAGGVHSEDANRVHRSINRHHDTDYKANRLDGGDFGPYKYGFAKSELEKVSLTPERVANRMEPHRAHGSTAYDRIETYALPEGGFHHVFYDPIGNDYTSVMHTFTRTDNPLEHPTASSASGIVPANKAAESYGGGFDNNPWRDNLPVVIHGETASRGPKGMGTRLYQEMAKVHGRMVSDSGTSAGANGVWEKLMRDSQFKGGLGYPVNHRHWLEYQGPKPVPTRIIHGDGRTLDAQLLMPENPYQTEAKTFSLKSPNDFVEVAAHHQGKRVGYAGYLIDHANKKIHSVGPYYQNLGIPGGGRMEYPHGEAKGVARKAAEAHTGYKFAGDAPEALMAPHMKKFAKSEEPRWWHGTPTGDLRGGTSGLHVGTKKAAEEALHARIGIPVEGRWDGTREYGKTLLAGQKTLRSRGIFPTGYNCSAPEEDHFPPEENEMTPYLKPDHKPDIFPLEITGPMSNSPSFPHDDFKANGYMAGQLKRGTAKRGFYYRNAGEDVGSVSATLPGPNHIKRIQPSPTDGSQLGKQESVLGVSDTPQQLLGTNRVTSGPSSQHESSDSAQLAPQVGIAPRAATRVEVIHFPKRQLSAGLGKAEVLAKAPFDDPSWGHAANEWFSSPPRGFHAGEHLGTEEIKTGLWMHQYGKTGDNGHRTFLLTDSPETIHEKLRPAVGHISGRVLPEGGFGVDTTVLHPRYQHQGLGTHIYKHLAKLFGGRLRSGGSQSPEAKGMWNKLANDPSAEVKLGGKFDYHEMTLKSESSPDNLLSMHGLGPQLRSAFAAAQWLTGKKTLPLDTMRQALFEHDGDLEAAALSAYGMTIDDSNRDAVRQVQRFSSLGKSEDKGPVLSSALNVLPEGKEFADDINHAIDEQKVEEVKLGGKHSSGTILARGKDHTYLLKPNDGVGPAAGAEEESATPSKREACFYAIAANVGLGDDVPECHLVFINGVEWAAIKMLPYTWTNLGKIMNKDPNRVQKALSKYREDGSLHKWGVLDFVLGNVDRHSSNEMISPDNEIKLIDHGSAFAGKDFDPANDKNSFVPFYLRSSIPKGEFPKMTVEDKLRSMPRLGHEADKALRNWVLALDAHELGEIMVKHGIHPGASLNRLEKVKAIIGNMSEGVCKLWVTT